MRVYAHAQGIRARIADIARTILGRPRSGNPTLDAMERRAEAMRLAARSGERALKSQREATALMGELITLKAEDDTKGAGVKP